MSYSMPPTGLLNISLLVAGATPVGTAVPFSLRAETSLTVNGEAIFQCVGIGESCDLYGGAEKKKIVKTGSSARGIGSDNGSGMGYQISVVYHSQMM